MQKINLFFNYYHTDDVERQAEIDFCMKANKESKLFSEIIKFDGRITYNDFFKQTANYPDDINILANTDIYFNHTINQVRDIKENECYCITRWEEDGDNIVRFRDKHGYNNEAKEKYSQDVWVIKGKARRVNGSFHLGIPGCDNRIAHELAMIGYKVTNPCSIIQCIHKHRDHNRSYNLPKGYRDRVPPPYKFIEPKIEVNQPIKRRKNIL